MKSGERTLIIDTGMKEKVCLDAMNGVIKELGLDLNNTDFFITHSHVDHIGLVSSLVTKKQRYILIG